MFVVQKIPKMDLLDRKFFELRKQSCSTAGINPYSDLTSGRLLENLIKLQSNNLSLLTKFSNQF